MTPPHTIVAKILDRGWLSNHLWRRLFLAVLAIVLAILCFFPRHYVAKVDLMPQDSGNSLGEALGQSGALVSLGALIGSHQSIEADLTIGRSQAVIRDVVARMHLARGQLPSDLAAAEIKLRKKVDVSAIRGSIMQVRVVDSNPSRALKTAGAFADAIQARLTNLSLAQAAQKRLIANNRLEDATQRLALAQQAITRYRTKKALAAPEIQLGAAVSELAALQGRLQAKQVELETLQRFATNDNVQVKAAQSEIVALQKQIVSAETSSERSGGPQLGNLARESTEYFNLYRDEKFSESLYSVYSKYLEGVTIDELSSGANLDLIEPPFVEPARQYNVSAIGLLALLIFLAIGAEYYIWAPPVGRRYSRRLHGD